MPVAGPPRKVHCVAAWRPCAWQATLVGVSFGTLESVCLSEVSQRVLFADVVTALATEARSFQLQPGL